MISVQFSASANIQQIEDFPDGCERSCNGAIHIRPNSTKMITVEELNHLLSLKIPLRVLSEPEKSEKSEEQYKKMTFEDYSDPNMVQMAIDPFDSFQESPEECSMDVSDGLYSIDSEGTLEPTKQKRKKKNKK